MPDPQFATSTPRRVKVFAIIALAVVFLFLTVLLLGGHTRHPLVIGETRSGLN